MRMRDMGLRMLLRFCILRIEPLARYRLLTAILGLAWGLPSLASGIGHHGIHVLLDGLFQQYNGYNDTTMTHLRLAMHFLERHSDWAESNE
jgi:hypothetical protein